MLRVYHDWACFACITTGLVSRESRLGLLRVYHDWACCACRAYLKELYEKQSDTSEAALREAQQEEIEHSEMMEYNARENERMAVIREKR